MKIVTLDQVEARLSRVRKIQKKLHLTFTFLIALLPLGVGLHLFPVRLAAFPPQGIYLLLAVLVLIVLADTYFFHRAEMRLRELVAAHRKFNERRELIRWAREQLDAGLPITVHTRLDQLWVVCDGAKVRVGQEIDIDRGSVTIVRILPREMKVVLRIAGPTAGYRSSHGALCVVDIQHCHDWATANEREKYAHAQTGKQRKAERAERADEVRAGVGQLLAAHLDLCNL